MSHQTRHSLPNGRFAVQDGPAWTLYDGPGLVLHVGTAASLLEHLEARYGTKVRPTTASLAESTTATLRGTP